MKQLPECSIRPLSVSGVTQIDPATPLPPSPEPPEALVELLNIEIAIPLNCSTGRVSRGADDAGVASLTHGLKPQDMVNAEEGDGAPSVVVWVDGVFVWEYTDSQTDVGQGFPSI
jgi:hypothetical protein